MSGPAEWGPADREDTSEGEPLDVTEPVGLRRSFTVINWIHASLVISLAAFAALLVWLNRFDRP
jgi:hypothetical protein